MVSLLPESSMMCSFSVSRPVPDAAHLSTSFFLSSSFRHSAKVPQLVKSRRKKKPARCQKHYYLGKHTQKKKKTKDEELGNLGILKNGNSVYCWPVLAKSWSLFWWLQKYQNWSIMHVFDRINWISIFENSFLSIAQKKTCHSMNRGSFFSKHLSDSETVVCLRFSQLDATCFLAAPGPSPVARELCNLSANSELLHFLEHLYQGNGITVCFWSACEHHKRKKKHCSTWFSVALPVGDPIPLRLRAALMLMHSTSMKQRKSFRWPALLCVYLDVACFWWHNKWKEKYTLLNLACCTQGTPLPLYSLNGRRKLWIACIIYSHCWRICRRSGKFRPWSASGWCSGPSPSGRTPAVCSRNSLALRRKRTFEIAELLFPSWKE